MDWNPFGEEAASGDGEAAGIHSPIGFHGLPRIHGGYYLAGRRFYDLVTGRMNAEDRIRGNRFEPSGQNLYVYGRDDIPQLLNDVLKTTPLKMGSNSKGLFADYVFNGNTYRVAYGTNGYIVSFYPID